MKQILRKKKGILKRILAVFALVLMLSFAFLVPCAAAYDPDGAMDIGGVPTIEEGLERWLGEYGENEYFTDALYKAGYTLEQLSSVVSTRTSVSGSSFVVPEWDIFRINDSSYIEIGSAFLQMSFQKRSGGFARYNVPCTVSLTVGSKTDGISRMVRLYFERHEALPTSSGNITGYDIQWKALYGEDGSCVLTQGTWHKELDYNVTSKEFGMQPLVDYDYNQYYVTMGFLDYVSSTEQAYLDVLLTMGGDRDTLDDADLPDLRWYDLTAYKDGYVSANNGMMYNLGYRQGANDTSEEYYTQGFTAGMQDAFNTGEVVLRTVSHMFEAPYRFLVTWLDIELFGINVFSALKFLVGSLLGVLIGTVLVRIVTKLV